MDSTIEYPLIKPDDLVGEAWAAMDRQDSGTALRLWQALREHSPERPEAHVWPIQILWQNGRLAEAEAMASEAFEKFPDLPDLYVQYAWIATRNQRWHEAVQRWAVVRAQAPERLEGYVCGARALWQCGRLEDAEAIAAEGLTRFPRDPQAMAESAWSATARQDWPEALSRWMQFCEAFPERLDGQARLIQSLRMVGRVDESEAVAAAFLLRYPDNMELLIEHFWAAVAHEDWPEAAARLEQARAAEQETGRAEPSLGPLEDMVRARAGAKGRPVVAAPRETPSSFASLVADDEISSSALMLAFESLGERCDFGAVQRHFGVEPLGLLRFAGARFNALLKALEDRFDAIGTVEDTGFETYRDETILRMKKYDLVFHTFVTGVAQETPRNREVFHQQQRRRLQFLKDKLIADLEESQKIFVYSTNEFVSDAQAARLFAAVRRYGSNSLLYVRPARGNRPEGTVEALDDGLFAGYFPGLTDFVGGGQPPFELWRKLCAHTYRLAKVGSPGNAFLKSLL